MAMATSHEPSTTFDHHSLEFGADPFTICEHLRNRHPVSWSDAHNGYWILANHELVAEAFRDYETFSSASGATIPDLSLGNSHIPTTVDPPDHVAYRQFLTPKFSKVAIKPFEGAIRTIVRELIGDAAGKSSWDFVKDLAEVVPGTVMLTLLGMAPERRREFSERMQRRSGDPGPDRGGPAVVGGSGHR
jgi:cytochrome P450